MADDVDTLLAQLRATGVKEIESFEKAHVYFRAQVLVA
jgi:hypothetical protein